LAGDDQSALSYLQEAERLKGSSLTSQETGHIPYLWEILSN